MDDSAIQYSRANISDGALLRLYRGLLMPRMIEDRMIKGLRQGIVSKWFSGIGQEAVAVGVAGALNEEEYILPMHRNLGVFTSRGLPLDKLFAQLMGKRAGYTQGRDRSFHFGTREHHIVGMISHLGAQMGVACGIALADKLAGRKRVTVVFSGDGGTSEGDFHEAMNLAAVWDLPLICVIENNSWGLSTPNSEQYRCANLADKGIGYGVEAVTIDGNNVLEVYRTIADAAKELREQPRPMLVEAMTYRMKGHEEASGQAYVPKSELNEWAERDPIGNYERFLLSIGTMTLQQMAWYREDIAKQIEAALDVAIELEEPAPDARRELAEMFAPHDADEIAPAGLGQSELRFIDAISDALRVAMQRHDQLVLMGQDIAEYGGVFKITQGFVERFGKERVRNTPICESAVIGAGLGLSINGAKSVIEMQFADFVTCGFNQIVNNLAKSHYRWGQNADVVIRMPTGAGVGAGPFHSQSNESWFTHTPGLKVVYPAFPEDAKGLLLAAIDDPNPVLYFEHKALYRKLKAQVPEGYYRAPIGKARRIKQGDELSIITYGMGVHWALEELASRPQTRCDLIDLRSLQPWDHEAVAESVARTGKVIVLYEATLTGGFGAEIAAWIAEHCFDDLDAPVRRVASLDTAVPMAPALEYDFLPRGRLAQAVIDLLGY